MLDYLLKRKLRYHAEHPTRKRNTHTLRAARTLGVLFDATSNEYRQQVLHWARDWEKTGKKLFLLGYFDTRQAPEDPGFPFFSKKERALNGAWKSKDLDDFVHEKPDLLLVLNPDDLLQIAYPAIRSQAAMKAGMPSEWMQDFDLIMETAKRSDLTFFLDQLNTYLDKLNTTHESARPL